MRTRSPMFLLLVTLAVMLPGILSDVRAQPIVPGTSPVLERFLSSVRAATPPASQIYAVSETFVLHRATYLLYPRRVILILASDVDNSAPLSTRAFWSSLVRKAHQHGVRYILGWNLPRLPSSTVVIRDGPGVLLDVGP